jgi:hypothetical protein
MRHARRLLIALTLVTLPHVSALAPPTRADSPLVLNEILAGPARDWDGSGTFSTRDDEWVELLNNGPVPLDLTGWLLTDGDAIPRYGLSGTLAPGERRIVTGRESYDWEKAHGQPAFGLSLSNTGDRVILWKVAGPDTVLMDSTTYASHEAAADRAIGRFPDGGGAWVLFDGLNPYTGTVPPQGNRCAPTPGLVNSCENTPTRTLTWGMVKSRYR